MKPTLTTTSLDCKDTLPTADVDGYLGCVRFGYNASVCIEYFSTSSDMLVLDKQFLPTYVSLSRCLPCFSPHLRLLLHTTDTIAL